VLFREWVVSGNPKAKTGLGLGGLPNKDGIIQTAKQKAANKKSNKGMTLGRWLNAQISKAEAFCTYIDKLPVKLVEPAMLEFIRGEVERMLETKAKLEEYKESEAAAAAAK
jgi:hypothetical protein